MKTKAIKLEDQKECWHLFCSWINYKDSKMLICDNCHETLRVVELETANK